MTISGGGYSYTGTASADPDGNVCFEIPLIPSGLTITVGLTVKTSDGTILYSGSKEQSVSGESAAISVALTRQYWTLTPGCISVVATSSSILYDPATWTSDSTTLSVTGLDAAPAGSSFTYEWKDESGATVGTDPTLTQTVYELYGSPAGTGSVPYGDITKVFTVTVSYTDATGTAVTADASAEVAIGGPVVLPTFSMNVAPPASGYDAANSNPSAATPLFALTSMTAGLVITADTGAAGFPAGTRFSLTISGTTFPEQASPSWTVSLADLGYTAASAPTAASPATLSIMCTASNNRAQVPEIGIGSAQAFHLTIPALKLTLTPPSGFPSKTVGTDTVYLVTDSSLTDTGKKFRLTVEPVNSTDTIPAGTKFSWKFDSAEYTTASADDNPKDVTAGTMCNISTVPTAQTSYTVSCTASLAGADDVSVDTTVYLAPLSITMKTGSEINLILTDNLGAGDGGAARSFAASATPPAAGTTTYKLSTDDSDVECLAWLDGTAIKYYAEGFTDAAGKIPLAANSRNMFNDCQTLTSIDVSGFDTSNVTDMSGMFYHCSALTSLDVSSFDTSNVTNMGGMFPHCSALTSLDVSSFDTSSVTTMYGMFCDCSSLTSLDVSNFDTSGVMNMGYMFEGWSSLTSLDLSSFDTSSVTNMSEMFSGCSVLTTIYASPSFVTDAVTDSTDMFAYCSSLKGGGTPQTAYSSSHKDKEYARIDGGSTSATPGYFTAAP